MNKEELAKIKQKALEEKIPIIMDDTLGVITKILIDKKPRRILEIGAAVGYSAMCFSEYLSDGTGPGAKQCNGYQSSECSCCRSEWCQLFIKN